MVGPDDFNGYGYFYVRLCWNVSFSRRTQWRDPRFLQLRFFLRPFVQEWLRFPGEPSGFIAPLRWFEEDLRFLLRRQAQDARHHGRYEPEGMLRCEEAALIADFGSGMYMAGFAGDDFSRCVPFCGGHAQDAWHPGRYGPEGQYVARRLFGNGMCMAGFDGYGASR